MILRKYHLKLQFCLSQSLNDDSDKDYLGCIPCLLLQIKFNSFQAGIFLFKVNNGNTKTKYEICSKLASSTPEGHHWRRSDVFLANFEQISRYSGDSIADFEEENVNWVISL